MELEIFTLADFAADYGNGKLNVQGTFDALLSNQFPTVHPQCSVAARIRVANSEAGPHQFEMRFKAPDGKDFHPAIKGDVNVGVNLNADYSTMNLVANFTNLKFDKPGKYAIEFWWDGEFRSGLTLTLVMVLPNAGSTMKAA